MRKDVGLILAAAVCFDLGVVVVPAHAATDPFIDLRPFKVESIKIGNLAPNQEYLKIKMTDVLVSSKACQADNGSKVVEFKGTLYCATGKHLPDTSSPKK